MNSNTKKLLEKQQYRFVGEHSAVKICGWTKKSLKDQGVCYKEKFYGINCHQCCQMSPAINFCNHDCIFCWRERDNSPFSVIDDPVEMVSKLQDASDALLQGFKGYEKINLEKLKESRQIKHVAISLSGEPMAYPLISKLIKECKKADLSTFLVTNGTFPKILKKIEMPTQLYISVEAPDIETYKKVDKPISENTWSALMESLDYLKTLKKKTRTALRLTLIRDMNVFDPKGYAKLIERANPMFIEVKAYMFVGASRQKLSITNMPRHEEVREFAQQLSKYCKYKIVDEQKESRVVLMMTRDLKSRKLIFS